MTDSRTTAKLCKLLRERGVEYTTSDDERAYDEPAKTTWDFVLCGLEMTVTATEFVDVEGKTYLEMDFHHAFTPEQAIAATLGSGMLTAEQVSRAVYAHSIHADCADADWQAIADELNATMGSGECDMTPTFTKPARIEGSYQEWECSECGEFTLIECMSGGNELPNFCSNCGAHVRKAVY